MKKVMSRRAGVYTGLGILVVGIITNKIEGGSIFGAILFYGGFVWTIVAVIGAIIEKIMSKK